MNFFFYSVVDDRIRIQRFLKSVQLRRSKTLNLGFWATSTIEPYANST